MGLGAAKVSLDGTRTGRSGLVRDADCSLVDECCVVVELDGGDGRDCGTGGNARISGGDGGQGLGRGAVNVGGGGMERGKFTSGAAY